MHHCRRHHEFAANLSIYKSPQPMDTVDRGHQKHTHTSQPAGQPASDAYVRSPRPPTILPWRGICQCLFLYMIGENRQLVTDEPVSLRNNRLKFKTAGKLPIILEEFIEYTPILIQGTRRMWTCNQLDLPTLGWSQPVMPKSLPDRWSVLKFFTSFRST